MRKPIPRNVGGSGGDVREAARAAATREGMDATQWIAEAVGQYAAQLGVDPAQLNENERKEAIAARLRRGGKVAPERPKSLLPRVEGWFGRAKSPAEDKGHAPHTDVALDDLLKRIDPHADFEALTRRVDRLEAELGQETSSGTMQPVRSALARLEERLNSLAEASAASPQAGLANTSLMASLASSVALPESAHGRQAGLDQTKHRSLGDAIAEITRRQRALDENGGAAPYEGRAPARRTTLDSLHQDIAALSGKVDEVRREQTRHNASPPVCNLDKLRGEIAIMSDALRDLASRGSIKPLEVAIQKLTEQIEASRSDGAREALLQPLENLVADLRLALAEADPRMTISGLEGEVKKLGGKLDNLGKCNLDSSALGAIDDRTRQIHELLSTGPADDKDARGFVAQTDNGDLQAIADELRRLMDDQGRASFDKIETRLEAIAVKVDEALSEARDESRYTALANRIDDVHRELGERLSQSTPQLDTHALEELVRGLADKMEEARSPRDNGDAIAALQNQVSAFAARLDQTAAGFPSLEHAIGELFAELERTRDVSSAAAEKAARGVLEEMLAKTAGNAGDPGVAHDLVELRTIQDEAGRRTFATLNAVHETLEKVVDRLAMVETEIAEVRTKGPVELLASGPAPTFAPAPGREQAATQPLVATKTAPAAQANAAPAERAKRNQQNDSLDDFLIEPGRGFPSHRGGDDNAEGKRAGQSSNAADASEIGSSRSDFIAAARRAAQAAQMESSAAMGRDGIAAAAGIAGDGSASIIDQTRSFITQHKRPVVLSIAALFLVMGAYAVVKTVGHSPIDLSFNRKHAPAAPARLAHRASDVSPRAPHTATPSHAAQPAVAPAHSASAGPQAIPGSDPIVTGSIQPAPKITASIPSAPQAVSPAVLMKLAKAGDAKAQYALANAYESGRDLSREPKIAAHWFEKAAAQNLAPAQYRLGSLYEKGLGVKRDIGKAMTLYRKAAENGNIRAMHNLAVLTAEGGSDGKPNYTVAAQWFRKAAEYGVRDSQYNLAILLARGLGVSQNLPLSYTWFAIAAAQGDTEAGKKRDDVGAHMKAADLVAAKATAAAFHPKTPDAAANDVAAPRIATSAANKMTLGAKLSQL
ncbi:MAG: hypothetical protein EPN75_03065 [Beijerinckiaceae bacterium]|nr:MAG: hypothetical protein EPN75_03065 [Beijerinckiaceae bacterium]